MSRRAKTPASEIVPDARQHVGTLNATKCIAYLRGVGAEIDDATAESWLDAEATHRFFRSERRAVSEGQMWSCRCGAMIGFSEQKRARRRTASGAQQEPLVCDACGTSWCVMRVLYVVRRDGTFQDYRPRNDRWQPIGEFVAECRGLSA